MPLGVEHARALFDAFREPELYRYIPGAPPEAVGDLATRFRRMSAGPSDPAERWWNWAVSERARSAAPFATVELSLVENGASAHLAYMFARTTWGRGFATEACAAALAYVRERARTRTVEAHIDTRNVRSLGLVERLGFRRVETIIGADHFKGSPSDEYHYRLALVTNEEDDAQTARR